MSTSDPIVWVIGTQTSLGDISTHPYILDIDPQQGLWHYSKPDNRMTVCGLGLSRKANSKWMYGRSSFVDCPSCGAALLRAGQAVEVPRSLAQAISDQAAAHWEAIYRLTGKYPFQFAHEAADETPS
jgi:hypothetical protein